MATSYCFESEEELSLFKKLFPSLENVAFSFKDWVQKIEPRTLLGDRDRLDVARKFKNSPLKAEEWLPTIEALREALVLTREHLEHCFNELPRTQKNRGLRDCFFYYLNSPLAEDWTVQVWQAISKLKTQKENFKLNLHLVCVPKNPSQFLFKEFSQALTYLPGCSLETKNLRQLSSSQKKTLVPLIYAGPRLTALESLATAIEKETKSRPNRQIYLSVLASARSRGFLKMRLKSLGVLSRDFFETKSPPVTPWAKFLFNLRNHSGFALKERLLLSAKLQNRPPFFGEELTRYLNRMAEKGILSPTELSLLLTFLDLPAEFAEPDRLCESVLWIPFFALTQTASSCQFSFADDALLEREPPPALLSEGELEILFRAGFHLPRWSETQKARLETLKELSQNSEHQAYTSLNLRTLEGFECQSPARSEQISVPYPETYTAPLSPRTLSATQLETFADCPSKYFYQRLKLQKAQNAADDYALLFGQSVHLTLEELIKPGANEPLTSERLLKGFEKALKATVPWLSEKDSYFTIFQNAFQKMIPRILSNEKTLLELFGPHETLCVEREFKLSIEEVELTGKIDRIDKVNGDHLVVLDYKTGTIDFTPEHAATAKNFQALVYWLAAEKEFKKDISAMLFYDLKKGEVRRGILSEEFVSAQAKKTVTRGHTLTRPKLEDLISRGKEVLIQTAKGIRQGDFTPIPSETSCRYCEAASLCRRAIGYQ